MAAIELYPYQQKWLKDDGRFKVGMFARQTGKTFTTTLELTLDCLKHEAAGTRTHWVILSRGERQAREAMANVKTHLSAYQAAFSAMEYEYNATVNALEITFEGGSRITALPANPDTARGFSANVFLDEFAFHQKSHDIWRALFPVISAGFKIRVVSTPNGKGNKFYELMTSKSLDAVWHRHTVNIHQAVADGLPRDVAELKQGINDADGWDQEFELKWLDAASSWLSYDLISGVEHASAGMPEHYQGGPCFVGVDIAIRNDLFVIWVGEMVGDVLWTRDIITRRRISFGEQDALLDAVFLRYNVVRCCMDQTGMGEKPVWDAQQRHGTLRVEGVLFTSASKLNMATIGKEAFEDKRLRIPLGDMALRADLHKLQKVTGPTGTPRFVAESDASGHADRTWGCFLALTAAATPETLFEYQGISRDPDKQNPMRPNHTSDKQASGRFGSGAW